MESRTASTIVAAVLFAAAIAPRIGAFQETIRASVDSSGVEGDDASLESALSPDGQVVIFASYATNLVAGDTNGLEDVFARDLQTGITERVSVDSSGAEADGECMLFGSKQASSGDGTLVVFSSYATNLVPNDTNGRIDVFLRDRSNGTTVRMSVDPTGAEGDRDSIGAGISADGRFAWFTSAADNLVPGDTNGFSDVFVRELATGVTERVNVDTTGAEADDYSWGGWISPDGRYVAFTSHATNLVARDQNGWEDVFLRDRLLGSTVRVSVDSSGNEGDAGSWGPSFSSDARFVAFTSLADDLVSNDTNGSTDVFLRDRTSKKTVLVSVDDAGVQGNGSSFWALISADGGRVEFASKATNLVPQDTNVRDDVFVREFVTGTTRRISVDSAGGQSDSESSVSGISLDGVRVAFDSYAGNLVPFDTNGTSDCFVHDLCSTPASWTNYGAGYPGTLGVPSFTSQQLPAYGATVTVDLANSLGAPTLGFLIVGLQRASIPTKFGGDLLVLPTLLVPITFSFGGDAFTGAIPNEVDLCGATVCLQGIEFDAGAAYGMSFSPGLELTIGQ